MTQTAQNLFTSLTPDIRNQVQNDMTTSISATIEMDKLVRLWRRTAQKVCLCNFSSTSLTTKINHNYISILSCCVAYYYEHVFYL